MWNLKPVKQNWFADSQRNEAWLHSRDPTQFKNTLPFTIEDPAWHFPRKIETKLKLGDADFEDLESRGDVRRAKNADELPPGNPFDAAPSSRAERAGVSPAPLPVAALLETEKKPPAKRGGQSASAPTPIGAATPAASKSAVRSALSAAGAPSVELPTPLQRKIQVHYRKSPAAAAATALPASPESSTIAESARRVMGNQIQAVQSKTAAELKGDSSLEDIVLFVGGLLNDTFSRRPTAKAVAKEVKKILSPTKPLSQALTDAIKETASEVVSEQRKGQTPKVKRSAGIGPPKNRALSAAVLEAREDPAVVETFKAKYRAEHGHLRGWNLAFSKRQGL